MEQHLEMPVRNIFIAIDQSKQKGSRQESISGNRRNNVETPACDVLASYGLRIPLELGRRF
jgi:hypothetical protein